MVGIRGHDTRLRQAPLKADAAWQPGRLAEGRNGSSSVAAAGFQLPLGTSDEPPYFGLDHGGRADDHCVPSADIGGLPQIVERWLLELRPRSRGQIRLGCKRPSCRHSLELRRIETKAPTDPGYLGYKFEPDGTWIVHDRALAVIVENERPIVFVASKLPIDSLPKCDDVSSANRRMVSALHKLGCDVGELHGLFAPFGCRIVIC